MPTTLIADPCSPWADGPYSIKRHGVTLTQCDAEPIQTPGCIQSHGVLLALRPDDLTIVQVSENSAAWLGFAPETLLGQSVAVVIGAEGEAQLRQFLTTEVVECNPLHAFTLPPRGELEALDATLHTVDGVALLELEATGCSQGMDQPDYYALLKKTVSRLHAANSLLDFCQRVTNEVRSLTGLDRVMVYRFHADNHGEVFAESRRDSLPPWLGLHYPAEDVPKPAREIFMKVWIRPLPDAKARPVEMVPLAHPETGRPLDMTYCALRGASIMYTEYLQNMGVAASLTMPIHRDGKLWGLIACHHYVPAHFSYRIRTACEFLAQVVSLQIKAVEDREHLVYRLKLEGLHSQLIALAAEDGGLAAMTDSHPNLLDGLDAGGVALYHRDRWWRIGHAPSDIQLDVLAEWLSRRPELDSPQCPVYATDELARDFPEAAAFADIASGLMAVSLSHTRRMFILWFRPETIQTIPWAGSPHDKPTVPGPQGPRLTPRTSFELFAESVRGRSLPWKAVEIEAAARLRLWVMELVVSRAERLAILNADLRRSNEELDTFAYVASHDLKEPLRGISKYAHQLLENAEALDEEHRQKLENLMRLTLRMDSLLDSLLNFSRLGRTVLQIEPIDLNGVVEEALEMVSARRAETQADIVIPRPLPKIACDRVRIREVFCNLISNALKYNDQPRRRVEIGYWAPLESKEPPGMPDGCGRQPILYVRDNGIGIEPRHFNHVFTLFKRLHGRTAYEGGSGAGLAIVRMLIERHHGHIWIDSKPGAGTTFYFTLATTGGNFPIKAST